MKEINLLFDTVLGACCNQTGTTLSGLKRELLEGCLSSLLILKWLVVGDGNRAKTGDKIVDQESLYSRPWLCSTYLYTGMKARVIQMNFIDKLIGNVYLRVSVVFLQE